MRLNREEGPGRPEPGGPIDPLDRARREAVDALVDHLADEKLGVGEFERRVRIAREAATLDRVRSALAGLPGRGGHR